jgi:hypothetical protein
MEWTPKLAQGFRPEETAYESLGFRILRRPRAEVRWVSPRNAAY